MKNKTLRWLILFVLTVSITKMYAQQNIITNSTLSPMQQSLVNISALTATGNLQQLKMQLNIGLDSGLTINEIKETLVQLYAYCGFPNSSLIESFCAEDVTGLNYTPKLGKLS